MSYLLKLADAIQKLQRLWNFQVRFCAVLGVLWSMLFRSLPMFPEYPWMVSSVRMTYGQRRDATRLFPMRRTIREETTSPQRCYWCSELCHTATPPHGIFRILSTDCGWSVSSVRIFSSHLKPSLSLRFPLQEAWTIGRNSMSSCSWPSGGARVWNQAGELWRFHDKSNPVGIDPSSSR